MQRFRKALLRWYDRHQRPLPWRRSPHPYGVWISEIMLQQTRVAAVLERYAGFLARFPDVYALARARPASVLAAWSGLGYYRRARMMHAAARRIVQERRGQFPSSAAEWRKLPGVGRYTAAALASICLGERCAVVDGNVERVLGRWLGAPHAAFWEAAQALLSPRRPGDFNQAMMELGALVCTPRAPRCGECPVRGDCRFPGGHGPPPRAPDSPPRRPRRRVHTSGVLAVSRGRVLLVRRGEHETVMPGMWELPPGQGGPWPRPGRRRVVPRATHGSKGAGVPGHAPRGSQPRPAAVFLVRHTIMETDYVVLVRRRHAVSARWAAGFKGARWVAAEQAARLPLTGLAKKILRRSTLI
jgi:A/G-specific adenine glycosylase